MSFTNFPELKHDVPPDFVVPQNLEDLVQLDVPPSLESFDTAFDRQGRPLTEDQIERVETFKCREAFRNLRQSIDFVVASYGVGSLRESYHTTWDNEGRKLLVGFLRVYYDRSYETHVERYPFTWVIVNRAHSPSFSKVLFETMEFTVADDEEVITKSQRTHIYPAGSCPAGSFPRELRHKPGGPLLVRCNDLVRIDRGNHIISLPLPKSAPTLNEIRDFRDYASELNNILQSLSPASHEDGVRFARN